MSNANKFVVAIVAFSTLMGANAQDYLIGESNYDALAAGKIIDGTKLLVLPEGASVILMNNSGEEFTLQGPYRGLPYKVFKPIPESQVPIKSNDNPPTILGTRKPDKKLINSNSAERSEVRKELE